MGRIGRLFHRMTEKAGLYRRHVVPWSGRVDGVRVRAPLVIAQGQPYFIAHEPWMDLVLAKAMRLFAGLFVDVGMNLGQTLIKVKRIDPARPVLGFEPNPACIVALQELIRLNRYQEVRVLPTALGDTDGIAELTLYQGPLDGSASIISGFRTGSVHRVEHIACMRFSALEGSMEIGRIGVVKIDVEGSESMVLAGMEQRLQQDRPVVVVEILPVYDAANTERLRRQQELESLMHRLDYRMLRIDRRDAEHLRLMEVATIGIIQDLSLGNYLLAPLERSGELLNAFNGTTG